MKGSRLLSRAARRAGIGAIALTSLAATAGCTVGPDFKRPDKPTVAGYTPENLVPQTASAPVPDGGAAQTFQPSEDIPGQWWGLFRSNELNALITQALKANPDVDAAQASLRQANETLYATQGSLFPTFTGNGSANNQRYSGAAQGSQGTTAVFGVTSASLNVSYVPDLWGGTRRQVEASAAAAEYQRWQLEATYLTLTSNVVVTAINMASLRAQIAATEAIIKLETDALNLVQTQFNLGGAARTDVLQQQATLTQTQATLPPLQKQLAQQRNALMRLLGLPPTDNAGQGLELASLKLPEQLPLSLPSQLVEQRPDVRSFEAQLHQASANIGVAIANQLPQITLTGQLGQTSGGFANMFTPTTGIWTLGFSIAQTLLDGGKLEHTKLAAIAGFDKAAAQYRSTVLSAFQDVANALRALQSDADTLAATVAAEQVAAQSLELSRQQYQLGATTYLQLLNAQQSYQTALLNRVQAQATRYSDTSALFQALGGGWWNRQDVDPKSKGQPGGILNIPPVQEIKLPRAGH
ncbi:efflux transporter, outer membrane factor (OMF) lipoprotein, NodT family [Enhydrobacter aerosaccus]|uniref:Efflux transporter, outer membrane factor (OMF) lipoprotein, NodT family n=1 Tax=Enhydrobacter aerosaccus TaxID=225324 RepID=A0A1T4MP08_9HYPH|nr:efflux transporter outer membrane subunit [Enhydrobacter aerosaccus]SJZ68611.1 efflux transporter, outer membrane factor (OMF) lipoprotein, NodT family [Enhydrobacter aerosaccus]